MPLHNIQRGINHRIVDARHYQRTAPANTFGIKISIFFGNAGTDQRAKQATGCRADTRAQGSRSERGGKRSGGNNRANAWNGQRAQANQETRKPTDNSAAGCAKRSAFGHLAVSFADVFIRFHCGCVLITTGEADVSV